MATVDLISGLPLSFIEQCFGKSYANMAFMALTVPTVIQKIKWELEENGPFILTGSLVEGLSVPQILGTDNNLSFKNSDLDLMFAVSAVVASQDKPDRFIPVCPGFVRVLAQEDDNINNIPVVLREDCGEQIKLYSSSGLMKTLRESEEIRDICEMFDAHLEASDEAECKLSPALTLCANKTALESHYHFTKQTDDNLHRYIKTEGKVDFLARQNFMDIVPSLKCHGWPKVANEWITRERVWPNRRTVLDIVASGFHLVCKTSPSAGDPHTEWRFSFSVAEVKLSRTLTVPQKVIFSIFKDIIGNIGRHIEDDFPEGLYSYQLKTVYYWALERIPKEKWTEQHSASRVLGLLDDFIAYLAQKCLPHYFIPDLNLLKDIPVNNTITFIKSIHRVRVDPSMYLNLGPKLKETFSISDQKLSTTLRSSELYSAESLTFLNQDDYDYMFGPVLDVHKLLCAEDHLRHLTVLTQLAFRALLLEVQALIHNVKNPMEGNTFLKALDNLCSNQDPSAAVTRQLILARYKKYIVIKLLGLQIKESEQDKSEAEVYKSNFWKALTSSLLGMCSDPVAEYMMGAVVGVHVDMVERGMYDTLSHSGLPALERMGVIAKSPHQTHTFHQMLDMCFHDDEPLQKICKLFILGRYETYKSSEIKDLVETEEDKKGKEMFEKLFWKTYADVYQATQGGCGEHTAARERPPEVQGTETAGGGEAT